MRYGLLAVAVAVCIGLFHVWLENAYLGGAGAGLSEEARVAIEIRCQGLDGEAARECRACLLYTSPSPRD